MIKGHTILAKCVDGRWTTKLMISNFKFCDTKAIQGCIELRYYCETLRESLDNLLSSIDEIGIELSDDVSLYYDDELGNYNSDICLNEYLGEFNNEKQRIQNLNVVQY